MKTRILIILGGIIILCTAFITVKSSLACECESPKNQTDYITYSDYIFQGTVKNYTEGFPYYKVKFDISKIWKGEKTDEITINSPFDDGLCGYPFKINQTMIIHATKHDDSIYKNECGGAWPIEYADEHIQFLNEFADKSTEPTCKSEPRPEGEGWVFVDCEWKQYADVPIPSCERGKVPANNYAWNSQDCLWEWSPLRNENSSGPTEHLSEEKPSVKLTDDQICGSGNKLINGICINPNVDHFDAGLNQVLLFVLIGVIISIVSFIIWRKIK